MKLETFVLFSSISLKSGIFHIRPSIRKSFHVNEQWQWRHRLYAHFFNNIYVNGSSRDRAGNMRRFWNIFEKEKEQENVLIRAFALNRYFANEFETIEAMNSSFGWWSGFYVLWKGRKRNAMVATATAAAASGQINVYLLPF